MAKRARVSYSGVAWLLIGGLVLSGCGNTRTPNEAHTGRSDMNQGSPPKATTHAHAQSLFQQGQRDQARTLVTPLLTSSDPDMASRASELQRESDRMSIREESPLSEAVLSNSDVIGLPEVSTGLSTHCPFTGNVHDTADVRGWVEQHFPLSPEVTAEWITVRDPSRVNIQRGVVASIDLTTGFATGPKIHLLNTTRDKVKPDFHVVVMNEDGIIILQHSESWLIWTLDPHESYTVSMTENIIRPKSMKFPRPLVFSKWAWLGHDIQPAYVFCAGSKTSYDQFRDARRNELRRVRENTPSTVDFPYEIRDLLRRVQPFCLDESIPIASGEIIESITFSRSKVRIQYHNRTDLRIKPDVEGWIFNRDGVIIGSFQDRWAFLSLAPGRRDWKSVSFSTHVPDELVFSRWASYAYDEDPAWFFLATSSKDRENFVKYAENRHRALKASASKRR